MRLPYAGSAAAANWSATTRTMSGLFASSTA
jgi:hypothetical protein